MNENDDQLLKWFNWRKIHCLTGTQYKIFMIFMNLGGLLAANVK